MWISRRKGLPDMGLTQRFQPMYLQIADAMKKDILSGKLKPGQKLPAEKDFCVELGVSRVTLRKAFGILESQGFLDRRKNAGTTISPDALSNFHLKPDVALVISTPDNGEGFRFDAMGEAGSEFAAAARYLARLSVELRLIPHLYESQMPEEIAMRSNVDGFVISGVRHSIELAQCLAENRIPHVCVESNPDIKGINVSMTADRAAASDCVSALWKRGRRSLAFFSNSLHAPIVESGNRRRLAGFLDGCVDVGATPDSQVIVAREQSDMDVEAEVKRLFTGKKSRRPDGIVCSTVGMGADTLAALRSLRINVPQDVSLMCVDITDPCQRKETELSGFYKDRVAVGERAAEMLLEWIRDPKYRPHVEQHAHKRNKGATL
jgi:DNA-binding LacI/PurR family transcriptional regulator